MIPMISLFTVIIVAMLIIKVATIALTYTGLSMDVARFQARSAFMGVGYTTNESEKVVNHPVRRKIIQTLMFGGSAGIATAITSLVLTFVNAGAKGNAELRLLIIIGGLIFLFLLARSKYVDRWISRLIGWALKKYSSIDIHDYASLLHMAGDYKVVEFNVEEDNWLIGKTLEKSELHDEGILILGITRKDGSYIGAPNGQIDVLEGDNLIMYGRTPVFEMLDKRKHGKRGDIEHKKIIKEQKEIIKEELEAEEEIKEN